MTHSLFSQNQDQPVAWFPKFDKEAIKEAIVAHILKDPSDTIELCKEPSKGDSKRFYGNTILSFYEASPKTGKPSLCILKGNNTYYKAL